MNGIPASRCPLLSAFIRSDPQSKAITNKSILKPKKCTNEQWEEVPVHDRTLWVIHRKALKEHKLEPEDFPFKDFLEFVADEEELLQKFIESRDEKIKKLTETNLQKINRQTKAIDRKLRERLRDNKNGKEGLIKAISKALVDGSGLPDQTSEVQTSTDGSSSVKKIRVKGPKAPAPVTPQADK